MFVHWFFINCTRSCNRYYSTAVTMIHENRIKESLTWPSGRWAFPECSGEFCWADRSQSTPLVPPPFCLEGLCKRYKRSFFCCPLELCGLFKKKKKKFLFFFFGFRNTEPPACVIISVFTSLPNFSFWINLIVRIKNPITAFFFLLLGSKAF